MGGGSGGEAWRKRSRDLGWKEKASETLIMKKMPAQEPNFCVSVVGLPHQDIGLPRFSGFPKRLAAVVAASAVSVVPRR